MTEMDWTKAWIRDCTRVETEAARVSCEMDPRMRLLLGRIWRMGFKSGVGMAAEALEEQQIPILA